MRKMLKPAWLVATVLTLASVPTARAAWIATPGMHAAWLGGAAYALPSPLGAALAPYAQDPGYEVLRSAAQGALERGVDLALLEELARRGGEASLPSADLVSIYRHGERLAGLELPVAPVLVDRYLKGLNQGVPFSRIVQAAAELEERLLAASRGIDGKLPSPVSEEERAARLLAIDDAAFALGQGITMPQLERTAELASRDPHPLEAVQAPVFVLGVLGASGVSAEQSLEVVTVAWDHGYRGAELQALGKELGNLTSAGTDVIELVLQQIRGDVAKDQVLDGLDELSGRTRDAHRPPAVLPGEDPSRGQGRVGKDKPTRDAPQNGDRRTLEPN